MREMIIDRLKKIYNDGITSFYVPGHKHGRLIKDYLCGVKLENIDFTEIDGTDNLHHAKDLIANAQNFASDYYGSESSYFLVNGTTTGILSAISAVGMYGDKILTTRDCHKSVYNAMTINDYHAVYADIDFDYEFDLSIGPNYQDYSKKLLSNKDVKAVVLTYPTYNGICYDIKKFIDLAHIYKIPVIIDEAHGAHFKMSDLLPESSLDYGADIVVQSTHKMLPAFTQSSMLHYKSILLEKESLENYLRIYQSSSPSYMLLASIDIAVDISEKHGSILVDDYTQKLKKFYSTIDFYYFKNVNYIIAKKHNVIVDPFKINIALSENNIDLNELESFLRASESIQCEYSNRKVSLFVASIATIEIDLENLNRGLKNFRDMRLNENISKSDFDEVNLEDNIKSKISIDSENNNIENLKIDYNGEYKKTLYMALKSKKQLIGLEDSIGRISASMITPYPPGIPYILPGEVITKSKVDMLKEFIKSSVELEGIKKNGEKNVINVILE
ncbi:MAG: hypothetical protein WBA54_00665 [Acidaminobacteraceae bacterium]